jgi:TolA-binding protein
MPIPLLIPIIIAAGGGGIVGALSRQPEINRLKKQVKILQQEIDRLQNIIAEQNRQIKELTIRYKAIKGWQFSEKAAQSANIKGYYLHLYSYKEYVELLCYQAKGNELQAREQAFFNAYEMLLAGNEIPNEYLFSIRTYIHGKYNYEIVHQIPYNQDSTLQIVESVNA